LFEFPRDISTVKTIKHLVKSSTLEKRHKLMLDEEFKHKRILQESKFPNLEVPVKILKRGCELETIQEGKD
jgi:hypothetical protein